MSATRRGLFFGLLGAPLALGAQQQNDQSHPPEKVTVENTVTVKLDNNTANNPVYVTPVNMVPDVGIRRDQTYAVYILGGFPGGRIQNAKVDRLAGEWIHLTDTSNGNGAAAGPGVWVHRTQIVWNMSA